MLLLYENIRKYRRLKGLNQVELGQSLGVSKQCISNWENDNVLPSVEMLVRLADFFEVSTDALLGRDTRRSLSADGLTDKEIAHIKDLVRDLREAHRGG